MSATTSKPSANATPFVTRCPDGYTKTSPEVRTNYQYSGLGLVWLMFGYTSLPRRIDLVCPLCGALFGSITDRKELEKFRFREPSPDER